jgi:hypothetical protein
VLLHLNKMTRSNHLSGKKPLEWKSITHPNIVFFITNIIMFLQLYLLFTFHFLKSLLPYLHQIQEHQIFNPRIYTISII